MLQSVTNSLPINSSAPNGLSQDLVDSLQSSNEVLLSASSYHYVFHGRQSKLMHVLSILNRPMPLVPR